MGATYIIPKKLGTSLGEELLLNAGNYRGADLEKRGVPFPVYARLEMPGQALQLMTLKAHLVAPMRQELPGIIAQEVAMHEKTFHQPEVKARIMRLFGP
jgi:polyketide biosynthesis enoyl-CoA hydratase PksI